MSSRIVKEWIRKADHDFIAAQTLLRNKRENLGDVVCFHCQQTIEKLLKAFLTSKKQKFPKSHDLGKLLTEASKSDGTMELIRDLIEPLTDYAVSSRYPGEQPSRTEAKQAVKVAEEAQKFILPRLK